MPRATRRRSARITRIVEQLVAGAEVSVRALAHEFRVSAATIRRDLVLLEQQGILSRTHGGAVSSDEFAVPPLPYRTERAGAKTRIAARAAASIPHGVLTVGFNGGSTTLHVARIFAQRIGVTVVTNSLSIAAELAGSPTVSLRVTGGLSRPASHQLLGPDLIRFLSRITLAVAVVGVDGISSESGLTISDRDEAVGAAAIMSRAARVIVVADSTKVGRVAATGVCGIADIDEIVTDDSADPCAIAEIERYGVRVSTGASRQVDDQDTRMCSVDCTLSASP